MVILEVAEFASVTHPFVMCSDVVVEASDVVALCVAFLAAQFL